MFDVYSGIQHRAQVCPNYRLWSKRHSFIDVIVVQIC